MLSIDPERKSVVTDQGVHEADILVVALGADLDVEATPGLQEVRARVLLVRRGRATAGHSGPLRRGRHRDRRPGGFLQMPTRAL